MHKYTRNSDFLKAARERFDDLCTEGFRASVAGEYWVAYEYDDLEIDVMYDDRDGRVTTTVRSVVGDRRPHSSLSCLYAATRLGPPQDIREIARNAKTLGTALDTQRTALRKVLHVVMGPDGSDLLLQCHGR